jgi:SpoVK/Ycf46/Vps4 family AAA+-type ATPase
MAVAQARDSQKLLRTWGLGDVVPYGHSVVLLFFGPPGVGKTASAEAIAHELGKPLLVVDYSQIQNCYVGVTEKNVVRVFRQAQSSEAVLFWDEADAMLYDRDTAQNSWEVRDVNVLLQEIEKFEGVCILATNREGSLDKALARRVSIKVHFTRPDRKMRRAIWEKLLPATLPLSRDVDLKRLSDADLTGGEIKNVILNAARLALQRTPEGPVRQMDFERALSMEKKDGEDGSCSRIGFASSLLE